jgi:hypothetical protein
MVIQNGKTSLEDVEAVIDNEIVDTVYGIFDDVLKLNELDVIFNDLTNRFAQELYGQSLLDCNLELSAEQRGALQRCVVTRGHDAVKQYLAKLNKDERTKAVYDIVKERCTAISDAVLSSIGRVVNRGAVLNAYAVQANAKNEDYDEILLRKTKSSGDITIPTNCILISTNCVSLIKDLCLTEKAPEEDVDESAEDGTQPEAEADVTEAEEPVDF